MSKTITCAILEDDSQAADLVVRYVAACGGITTMGVFSTSTDLQLFLLEHDVDLLIADIQLPDMDGFQLIASLPVKPLVVLCTGHNQLDYSNRGYDIDAVDYLTKPLAYDRFAAALDKVRRRLRQEVTIDEKLTGHEMLKRDGGQVKVYLADIVYIESVRNYVNIYLVSGKTLTFRYSLKEIALLFAEPHFVQIHKSYIVALRMVFGFTKKGVNVNHVEKALPLGREYKKNLAEAMKPS